MSWSDAEFCARVVRRCEEVGRSQRAVLKEAQCAHDYLQTNPQHGRRIDRIVRIAEVLNTDLAQILGLRVNGRVEFAVLLIAYRIAREAMQLVQHPDDELFVENMVTVYNVLLLRRENGQDIEDPAYWKTLVEILTSRVSARSPRPTSKR